jgi:hypothetical protein
MARTSGSLYRRRLGGSRQWAAPLQELSDLVLRRLFSSLLLQRRVDEDGHRKRWRRRGKGKGLTRRELHTEVTERRSELCNSVPPEIPIPPSVGFIINVSAPFQLFDPCRKQFLAKSKGKHASDGRSSAVLLVVLIALPRCPQNAPFKQDTFDSHAGG